MTKNKWISPVPGCEIILHKKPHPGAFGSVRRFDVHCGLDIYCKPEQIVIAVEDGEIILIENFTGEHSKPPTPWWHNTQAVLIKGKSGVVVYGEIRPFQHIVAGKKIKQGDLIGNVIPVLKKNKGLPMTMLHMELYKSIISETVIWNLGKPKPELLLNPTKKLLLSA